MTCKPTQNQRHDPEGVELGFRTRNLKPEGRLQFFFHCPQSSLPIRDVVGKRKKEPHIEKNAENYCVECYQNNIVGFLKSREKYLFLVTRCASRAPALRKLRGERLIVGYIAKERWLRRRSHYAVQGFTKIVPFDAAFPLSHFGPKARHWRMRRFDEHETSLILDRLGTARNIRAACIREIRRLSKSGTDKGRPCK